MPEQKKKNSEEIIAVWTTLKPELTKLMTINQHKLLIIEAIEFHLHQASYFTSENSSEAMLNRYGLKKEKERLTQELEQLTCRQVEHPQNERDQAHFESVKESIRTKIHSLDQALRDNSVVQAFAEQKRKNEQIVKECQQLLAQLK